MFESDEEYSFVVLTRVNSVKKVRKSEKKFCLAKVGKTQMLKILTFVLVTAKNLYLRYFKQRFHKAGSLTEVFFSLYSTARQLWQKGEVHNLCGN